MRSGDLTKANAFLFNHIKTVTFRVFALHILTSTTRDS